MVIVKLPALFQKHTAGKAQLELQGACVGELIQGLLAHYPELKPYFFQEDGNVTTFLCFFLNQQGLAGDAVLEVPVAAGDTLSLVLSTPGG